MEVVAAWLRPSHKSICWSWGPAGSGKTDIAQQAARSARMISDALALSACSIDRCLWHLIGADGLRGPITFREVRDYLEVGGARLLVLDGLDADAMIDVRLRRLLADVAADQLPELKVLITSRLPPAADLGADITVIEISDVPIPHELIELPLRAGPPTVMEVLAASRWAVSGWMLGLATGLASGEPSVATPAAVAATLTDVGYPVARVCMDPSGEWFQIPPSMRPLFADVDRAAEVRRAIAEALQAPGVQAYLELAAARNPEVAFDVVEEVVGHLVATGDVDKATRVYWEWLGNFATLRAQGRVHRGARVCRVLNRGKPPNRIAPELRASDLGIGVVNDWGQHAQCAGDVETAVEAAGMAHWLATTTDNELAPWDRALLARHVSKALLHRGDLPAALTWARRAHHHATMGIRLTEGMPTAETMAAFEHAAAAAIEVAARTGGASAVESELRSLVEIHERQRGVLRRANWSPLPLPFPGPVEPVEPEKLLAGQPAALAAVLRGDADGARRILSASSTADTGTLAVRVGLIGQPTGETRELLQSLRRLSERTDDAVAECELAGLAAHLALTDGEPHHALAIIDACLATAVRLRLGLHWIDLLILRSRAYHDLGRTEEARVAALLALSGNQEHGMLGAADPHCGYRLGARAAIDALTAAGGMASPTMLAAAVIADEPAAPAPAATTDADDDLAPQPVSQVSRRRALHDSARRVLEEYVQHGHPFVLYFRTFDVTRLHGPFEYGGRLLENIIRRALPPSAGMVTVQDRDVAAYQGTGTVYDRATPALLLAHDSWKTVVEPLIGHAELIISECQVLTSGVRFELETILHLDRWDRTVLVFPPGPATDSDPIVQMFPRCAWNDEFTSVPFTELPVVADLISRLRAIADLPEHHRLALADNLPDAPAHPVDLVPLAIHYETTVRTNEVFDDHRGNPERHYRRFWRLVRAAAARSAMFARGDTSLANRGALAADYLDINAILLDVREEDGKVVLNGDLTFAEQCTQSALTLAADERPDLRERAEHQYQQVRRLTQEAADRPASFVVRPGFGPITIRPVGADGH